MQKLIFMRHAPTKVGNNHFKSASYEEFMAALLKKDDPPILPDWHPPTIEMRIDQIICSDSLRALETAHAMSNLKTGYTIMAALAEIKFAPDIISKAEFTTHNGHGDAIRNLLLTRWFQNKNSAERFFVSMRRLSQLLGYLQAQPGTNLLCITHGFLLRLIAGYFEKDISIPKFTLDDLLAIPRFEHGEYRIYHSKK